MGSCGSWHLCTCLNTPGGGWPKVTRQPSAGNHMQAFQMVVVPARSVECTPHTLGDVARNWTHSAKWTDPPTVTEPPHREQALHASLVTNGICVTKMTQHQASQCIIAEIDTLFSSKLIKELHSLTDQSKDLSCVDPDVGWSSVGVTGACRHHWLQPTFVLPTWCTPQLHKTPCVQFKTKDVVIVESTLWPAWWLMSVVEKDSFLIKQLLALTWSFFYTHSQTKVFTQLMCHWFSGEALCFQQLDSQNTVVAACFLLLLNCFCDCSGCRMLLLAARMQHFWWLWVEAFGLWCWKWQWEHMHLTTFAPFLLHSASSWIERSRSWCFKFGYVIKVRAVVSCY